MKIWDFYEYFKTREEAQAYKRENKGRKTSRINEIVMDQYHAVVNCERVENEYTGFNRKGNVRQRDTVYINDVPIIISLGTGRIYVRE